MLPSLMQPFLRLLSDSPRNELFSGASACHRAGSATQTKVQDMEYADGLPALLHVDAIRSLIECADNRAYGPEKSR